MPYHKIGKCVLQLVAKDGKEKCWYPAVITQRLANNRYEIAYDSYGTCIVREDAIFEDVNGEPRRRNIPLVSTYKDVDEDVMDIELKMEKDEYDGKVYDEDEEFEVEGIVDRRMIIIDGNEVVEFLIKWKDYDVSENTWEPYDQLQQNDLVLADINEWMLIKQPIMMEDTSVDDQDWDLVLESWKKVLLFE
ncbi:MAG: hypothetical protein ACI90V_008158 [Bacillariaceae sp.]|jgi:hypothetical protein